MMNKKKMMVAAVVAGLMALPSVAMAGAAFPGHDCMKKTCGMNGCKGKGSCKGAKHSCGGQKNGCAAKVQDGKLTS